MQVLLSFASVELNAKHLGLSEELLGTHWELEEHVENPLRT
jgi:hypothetical protein